MSLDYWRLSKKPFEASPDPEFFWASPGHEEALQRLLFSTRDHRGAMVLTGEYGCGKTLLSRLLIAQLSQDLRCQIALIVNPRLNPQEFLKMLLFQLGGSKERGNLDKADLLSQIEELLDANAKSDRETTLLIDDAQAVDEEVLEEIRLLMNFQRGDRLLMNLIFFGQPELKDKISRLKQLNQRIQLWFHLIPFRDAAETAEYVRHRLRVAGVEGEIFAPEAFQRVFVLTDGVPRLINNLCNMALWIGAKTEVSKIDAALVETAGQALKG